MTIAIVLIDCSLILFVLKIFDEVIALGIQSDGFHDTFVFAWSMPLEVNQVFCVASMCRCLAIFQGAATK